MANSNIPQNLPKQFVDLSERKVHEILRNVKHVNFCMLCTADGFEVATATKKTMSNTGKVAAVSSSIIAMVSAFISEINLDECQTITLDAKNGKALLTAVPHPTHPAVLVALTDKEVLLGQILYELKTTSEELGKSD